MTTLKPRAVGAIAIAATIFVAACNGTGSDPQSSPTTGGSSGTTAPTSEDSGETYSIGLSYQAAPSESDPWHHMAVTFKDLVEEASQGRITVDLFGGGQLTGGDQQTEIELVQNGTIAASILPTGTLTAIDPRFQIAGLPWLVPTEEVAEVIMDGPLGAETMDWLRDKGLEPLAIGSNGFRQLANSQRPVTEPADVEGLKIRVPGSQVLVQTWEQLGAEPVVVNFAELYTALQQGTVDGEELPFVFKLSTKFHEVESFATEINYSWDIIYLVMNPEFWEGLSPEDQDLIQTAATAAAEEERAFLSESTESVIEELRANGMDITILDADQLAEFQRAAAPVYEEFESAIGAELIQRWQAASN